MLTYLRQRLQHRQAQGLTRRRLIRYGSQGPRLCIDGREFLNFCSNDYLGLAAHPAVSEALAAAARHYGTGAGASHLINGHSIAHHSAEETLAAYTGRDSALLFSTGYMANIGVISALAERQDGVFMDRLNHASLVDGALLSRAKLHRYAHNDPDHLETLLRQSKARHKLIITDGVFSMDGDMADLPALVELAGRYQAWLMVDDAHGLGVMGDHGGGVLEHFALGQDQVPVLVGTLGKALGVFGAFVAGATELSEYLLQFARPYIYTTALPPALAVAVQQAVTLARTEPQRRHRLHALVKQFRAGARDLPITNSITPIQPVILGDSATAMAASQALYAQGILVTAIRPPTVPQGSARLRITLSAAHQPVEVDRLLEALKKLAM